MNEEGSLSFNLSPEQVERAYREVVVSNSVRAELGQLAGLGTLKREVQTLMGQAVYRTPVPVEQTEVLGTAIAQRPYLREQLIHAYSTGGIKALEQLFEHPIVPVTPSTLREWLAA